MQGELGVDSKLKQLERIAKENAEYSQRMRSRFVHSNIVGVDIEENDSDEYSYEYESGSSYSYDYEYEEDGYSKSHSEDSLESHSEDNSENHSEEDSYSYSYDSEWDSDEEIDIHIATEQTPSAERKA